MKIVKLQAEHFKRLKVVEITPAGDIVTLAGKNGAGKSSVIDAIFAALAGKEATPAKPIQRGQTKARITLDLGDLVVTRRFTEKDSTVTVEAANGARFPSPQRMLDELIGHIAFDPLQFVRMEPRRQFDMLRKLVKLEVDIDALNGQNQRDYEKRTEINRQGKALRAQAEGIVLPPECPTEHRDTAEILGRLTKVSEHNAAIEREKHRRTDLARDIAADRDRAEDNRGEAARLRALADEHDAAAASADIQAAAAQERLDGLQALVDPMDAQAIRSELESAEDTNRMVDRAERRAKLIKDAETQEAAAQALSDQMKARDQAKGAAINAAKFPIAGLAFGDGEVLFDGLPLTQASSAEQIRISMAIAAAMNPKLRVVCIREGSFLDPDGLRLVAELAKESGSQVWLEDNRSTDPMAIIMEDGAVVRAEVEPEPKAAALI